MRLGLALPTFGTDAHTDGVIIVSRTAEDLGYDSLWTGDRVLAPARRARPIRARTG